MNKADLENGGTIAAYLFRRVGDSLLGIPALRALKQRYPATRLIVLSESHVTRIFEGLSFIDMTIDVGKSPSAMTLSRFLRNQGQLTATLDFLSDPRTALATIINRAPLRAGFAKSIRQIVYNLRIPIQNPAFPIYSGAHKLKFAEVLGAKSDNLVAEFALQESDTKYADTLLAERGFNKSSIVSFFVSSRREYKRWPILKFVEIANHIQSNTNVQIAVIGGPGQKVDVNNFCKSAGLAERSGIIFSDLGHMAAFLHRNTLFIGNDGGPKHLCVAVNCPTVTIFQNDPSEYWTPPNNPSHTAVGGMGQIPSVSQVMSAIKRIGRIEL